MQIGVDSSRAVENKRIFVVESDEINRAVLQFMLHDENETHELASLDEAFVKAREWKPDLVLLGLGIVRESGTSVLEEIASRIPKTRILIVAEIAGDALAQACMKLGAHGLVSKPFTVESVRGRVDVMLGRGRGGFIPLVAIAPAKNGA
jgi:CheY-like chemotaxis protein